MGSSRTRLLFAFVVASTMGAKCGQPRSHRYDGDEKSGPDYKRSGANVLRVNKARTDEVSFSGGDKTDWFVVTLKGHPGVLGTNVHWDDAKTDLMLDVFDEFGKQLSSSPTRAPGSTEKSLLTQIDPVGVYYIRVTAPRPDDDSVYTLEAKWDVEESPLPGPSEPDGKHASEGCKHDCGHTSVPVPRETKTIEGHIVNAYRDEGGTTTIHIDKGSAAGVTVGMTGTMLNGPSGDEPVSGGAFTIVNVLDEHKSLGRSSLRTVGKNTRVSITVPVK